MSRFSKTYFPVLTSLLLLFSAVPKFASAQPEEASLLWKIERDDVKPSYVFGTFHILPQSAFVLHDKVKDAFAESDLLVLELDIDSPSLQTDIMQHAGMDNGETLDKLLPNSAYAKINEQLQEVLGVGLQPFNTFKPLLIASFLTAKFIGEQPASFEATLAQMALSKGIEVQGIETVAEQMKVFDNISYVDQAADLVEMVEEEEKVMESFSEMLALYQAEDQAALYKMMEDYIEDPKQIEQLIHQRNSNWIPRIEEKARKNATFFGVGAGHLGGEKGVLVLLKEAGFKVTAVTG